MTGQTESQKKERQMEAEFKQEKSSHTDNSEERRRRRKVRYGSQSLWLRRLPERKRDNSSGVQIFAMSAG